MLAILNSSNPQDFRSKSHVPNHGTLAIRINKIGEPEHINYRVMKQKNKPYILRLKKGRKLICGVPTCYSNTKYFVEYMVNLHDTHTMIQKLFSVSSRCICSN